MMKQNKEIVWKVWEAGQRDPEYARMLEEIRILENKYEAVLRTLSTEQQGIICDFISQCENMSWRLLEIACEGYEKMPEA